MRREEQLVRAFVDLSDVLDTQFDSLSLFQRLVTHCVELLPADAAAVLVADARGGLRTVAASDDDAAFLEMLQLQSGKGPCVECWRTGQPADYPDFSRQHDRWPTLVSAALGVGFHAVHTLPLKLHDRTVGALNLFRHAGGELSPSDARLAQALSDVAGLALMNWTSEPVPHEEIFSRVQRAIVDKAALETAKGIIAQHANVSIAEASALLRAHTQHNRVRPTEVARDLVTRAMSPASILEETERTKADEAREAKDRP